MLLSRNLLNQINPKFKSLSTDELTVGLNAIGIEVEEVLEHRTHKGLRVGKILSAEKHPDSDHLNVCQVQLGDEVTQIVCGAPNLPIGYQVVVAPIGYKFSDEFVIAERKIRGVVSKGMMCGYNELTNLFTDAVDKLEIEGLIRIDPNIKLTDDELLDYLGLNDTILDLSLPSNRNELNGIYWIAYELNAYFKFDTSLLELHDLVTSNDLTINIQTNKVNDYGLLEMSLNNEYDYTRWNLKKYLINSGIHVTNTFADYGNFLTLLFSNPVHMFNKDLITSELVIKELEVDTKMLALDNKEYELKKGTVVSMVNNEIIAAIGMMGSKKFAIDKNTKNIYLEIANLNSDYLRQQAKVNKINTTSSTLFSKPLAKMISAIALDTFATSNLVKNLVFNLKPIKLITKDERKEVYASISDINKFLGINLTESEIISILNLTGFKYFNERILVPAYRLEIHNLADVCEEILKSIDINNFKVEPILASVLNFKKNQLYDSLQTIRQYLVSQQFIETKTYNLASLEDAKKFNWFNIDEEITILNPLSNQRETLRHSLVHQLLNVLVYNQNHKEPLRNIFEIQKIQIDKNNAFTNLTVLLNQDYFIDVLNHEKVVNSILTLKEIFNGLLSVLNRSVNYNYDKLDLEGLASENGLTILSKNNEVIGYLGTIKKTTLKEYGLKNNIYCLSINLDKLLESKQLNKTIIKPISEFNPIYKDFSFTNKNRVLLDKVFKEITDLTYISEVKLVDSFMINDLLSYTMSVKIQSFDKTLSNDEIEDILHKIRSILEINNLQLR